MAVAGGWLMRRAPAGALPPHPRGISGQMKQADQAGGKALAHVRKTPALVCQWRESMRSCGASGMT